MSWEWVVLILGIVGIIALLFGWVAWTNTKDTDRPQSYQ